MKEVFELSKIKNLTRRYTKFFVLILRLIVFCVFLGFCWKCLGLKDLLIFKIVGIFVISEALSCFLVSQIRETHYFLSKNSPHKDDSWFILLFVICFLLVVGVTYLVSR